MSGKMPESLARTIASVHGERGREWLTAFDELVAYCERTYRLRITRPYDLSYNYVAAATLADGTDAALKLCVPSAESRSEEQALRRFAGEGAARVLASEPERGILLMEQAKPGHTLHALMDDAAAMRAAAGVMRRLWKPAPTQGHPFPTVTGWTRGLERLRCKFDGGTGPLPERLVVLAERTFESLLATAGDQMLLHGDLHHGNIVAGEREPWLAIDPKGVIGEAEYEVCALLTNNLPEEGRIDLLRKRVNVLCAELPLSRKRVIQWAMSFGVLSASWCIEDGVGDPMASIARAELFERILDET